MITATAKPPSTEITPLVSVVMAVHNGERHLRAAMDSLMAQTCGDVEFVVIDDGSTDSSAAILTSYAGDPRLVLLANPANIGLTKSLNLGLARARGLFIARMDADDVALPERLQRQLDHLRHHPDTGVLGLFSIKIDETGARHGPLTPPVGRDEVRWDSLFINPFHHPGIMFRRALLQRTGPYDETLATAQDFDLFARMLAVTEGENLPEFLLLYRVHADSITTRRRHEQLQVHDRIMQETIHRVTGRAMTAEQVRWLRSVVYAIQAPDEPAPGERAIALYVDLLRDFLASGRVARPAQVVARALLRALLAWRRHGFSAGWLPSLSRLAGAAPLAIPATAVLCLRLALWRRRGHRPAGD